MGLNEARPATSSGAAALDEFLRANAGKEVTQEQINQVLADNKQEYDAHLFRSHLREELTKDLKQ